MPEAIQDIFKNIVDAEVMNPMEQIAWSHESPPPSNIPATQDNPTVAQTPQEIRQPEPARVDNPPVVEKSAEPTPATTQLPFDWESLRQPNGLILGKYKDSFEATKGVANAVELAKTALRERDSAVTELNTLRRYVNPPAQAPQTTPFTVPQRVESSELDKALAKIVEEGGTIDEDDVINLREAINKTSQNAAMAAIKEFNEFQQNAQDAERAKWAEVDDHMRNKYPESIRFVDEISLNVQTDPLLKLTVDTLIRDGKHKEASELAYLSLKQKMDSQATQSAQTEEIKLTAAEEVRKEAVAQARKDAGVMTTIAGGVHEAPQVGPTSDDIEAAAAEMRRTGLGEKWRQMAFGRYLNDPIFN